jgi:ketosteroid isomerase-like protein
VSGDLIREIFDDFNREDWEAALAKIHPNVDWGRPPDMPDVEEEVWRGHAAVYSGIERFMLAWEQLTVHLDAVRDEGDLVIVDSRWAGRSRGTRIDVEWRLAQIYELRDGKVARVRQFRTFEEALTAAGLA